MAFIDELNIHLAAGKGGNGVVRWLNLKGKEFSGPAGGNGGSGGNVYAHAVRDVSALDRYTHQKKYRAENGGDGGNRSKEGKNGDDFILEVPIGSVVTNLSTDERFELLEDGEQVMVLKGGTGGKGNEHFKGSKNTTPKQSTPGTKGEEADFHIELKLVVDAGFVGLPNAGKSSLVNMLTGSQSKVGAYAFTTLNPSLGMLYGHILADIPGLIEGASSGKGLGHAFLRHISRTKTVVHCVSVEHEDVAETYRTVRGELDAYSKDLHEKPELVVLTKTDLASGGDITRKRKMLADAAKIPTQEVTVVSIYDDESIKELSERITKGLGSKG